MREGGVVVNLRRQRPRGCRNNCGGTDHRLLPSPPAGRQWLCDWLEQARARLAGRASCGAWGCNHLGEDALRGTRLRQHRLVPRFHGATSS